MIKILLLGLLLFTSLQADAGDDSPPLERVYVADQQAVQISHTKQLTTDGTIKAILPNPGGTRLAFLSSRSVGSDNTTSISTIGLIKNDIRTYATAQTDGESGSEIFDFGAWSPDGRYLSATYSTSSPTNGFSFDILVIDMSSGQSDLVGLQNGVNVRSWSREWGPDNQLAFTSGNGNTWSMSIYQPSEDKLTSWPMSGGNPPSIRWVDQNHVAYFDNKLKSNLIMDVPTGQIKRANAKIVDTGYYPVDFSTSSLTLPDTSTHIGLSLENKIAPASSSDGAAHSATIDIAWVGLHGLPALTKRRPANGYLPAESFLEDASEPRATESFIPHRLNASTTQLAILAHGNLYLSKVSIVPATVREAIDAGENVPCKEEELLAASNLKQIGLAMLQYSQDYDNVLPPAGNFHDEVYPYVKDESVFSVGDYNFSYAMDGEDSTTFDKPGEKVAGELVLPCAKVVLYLDGHVQGYEFQRPTDLYQTHSTRTRTAANIRRLSNCGCGT